MTEKAPSYTLTEDYSEDGRVLWRAGTVMGWDTAYLLKLVPTKTPPKVDEQPKPSKAEK